MTTGAGEAGRPATATVLFTDLVGSTALRQAVGDDAADEVRRSHDRVLRDAIGAHGGHEVKGTDDGLMVVFDSAVEAVAAAEAMQRGVERLTRRAPAPVPSRSASSPATSDQIARRPRRRHARLAVRQAVPTPG